MCKIVGGDEGRRPEEEVGRTPRLEVGCIQRRVEGSGGVTHTETAEEVRKDFIPKVYEICPVVGWGFVLERVTFVRVRRFPAEMVLLHPTTC